MCGSAYRSSSTVPLHLVFLNILHSVLQQSRYADHKVQLSFQQEFNDRKGKSFTSVTTKNLRSHVAERNVLELQTLQSCVLWKIYIFFRHQTNTFFNKSGLFCS
ncbi:hypothetical protein CHARACLAT_009552 [Characodon lateralis]|uniref:Secreted protein n=1 Tax=Characodon lateralis TaxID=208331 RepID=A0ABU7F2R0_9TELE|nr:hypothetical protein [Characodon lateralis]